MIDTAALRRAERPDYLRLRKRDGKWVLRRSFVQAFLGCPVYAASTSTAARLGIYHHDNFAAYTLECKRRHQDTLLSETDRIARETFFAEPRGLGPAHLRDGKQLLDRFARMWPSEWSTLRRVEHTLAVDIGWAVLTGTIDREDRLDNGDPDDPPTHVRLRDYKTGWGRATWTDPNDPADDMGAHEFQMRFYAALRFQEPGSEDLETVEEELIFPRRNMEPIQTLWTRSDWEHGELGEWWREEVVEPLTEWWPKRRRLGPHGGPQCVYCAKRFTCALADLGASQVPESEEHVDELFEETLRLDEAIKERRQQLATFFAARPPMVLDGFEIGYLVARDSRAAGIQIAEGADEAIVAYMNSIAPGQGDLVRRSGVDPKLIAPEWYSRLVDEGLAVPAEQDPKFKWRKATKKVLQEAEAAQEADEEAAVEEWPPEALQRFYALLQRIPIDHQPDGPTLMSWLEMSPEEGNRALEEYARIGVPVLRVVQGREEPG